MRWTTIVWFTVTAITANAVEVTVDNDLFMTTVTPRDHVDTTAVPPTEHATTESNPEPTSETTVAPAESTVTTSDTTTTPVQNTTVEITTISNYDKHTTEETTITTPTALPEETTSKAPDTSAITTTTEKHDIPPDQVGRSSEAIEEPDEDDGNDREYIILTSRGPVQGYPWRSNADIIAYVDVPYGSFDGYFQEASLPPHWENIHQVREHNKRCPQMQDEDYVGDLDCLTLSIFTPSETVNASVLVHIHDSYFSRGSGDPAIYGPEYIVSKGTILVLPNYRLGPLGFLCLHNEIAPGNAALKDLTLALQWLRQNIALFGGDPTNVVISGEGTSGALVGYLALSPRSNGYINKVIAESGSVLSYWALNRNPEVAANTLLEAVREVLTSNTTIEGTDAEIIVRAASSISFTPCIENNDNPFLTSSPWTLMRTGPINITFMIGSASHAGSIEAIQINQDSIEMMNSNFGHFLPNDLRFDDQNLRSAVGNRVKNLYFGSNNITLTHVEEISLWLTDSSYLGPAIRTSRALLGAGTNVFFYEFAFVGELNRELNSIDIPLNKTARGDIVGYLFSQDGMVPAEGTVEKRMVDLMVDLWISFIRDGIPTAENVTWDQLNTTSASDEQWLYIGDELEMRQGLHVNRLNLWTSIYNDHFIEHNLGHQIVPKLFLVLPFIFWTI